MGLLIIPLLFLSGCSPNLITYEDIHRLISRSNTTHVRRYHEEPQPGIVYSTVSGDSTTARSITSVEKRCIDDCIKAGDSRALAMKRCLY